MEVSYKKYSMQVNLTDFDTLAATNDLTAELLAGTITRLQAAEAQGFTARMMDAHWFRITDELVAQYARWFTLSLIHI